MSMEPLVPKVGRDSIMLLSALDGEECEFGKETLVMRNKAIIFTFFQIISSVSGLLLYLVRKSKGITIKSLPSNQPNSIYLGTHWNQWGCIYEKIIDFTSLTHYHICNRVLFCF